MGNKAAKAQNASEERQVSPRLPQFKVRFSGTGLASMDVGFLQRGKSDPYLHIKQTTSPVQGSLTREVAKTSVQVQTLSPRWEEQALHLDQKGMVTISCWDQDTFKSDDCIGTVTVNPEQFVTDGVSLYLTNPKTQTYSGTINAEWLFNKEARDFWEENFHTAPKVPWANVSEAIERKFPNEYTSLLLRMQEELNTMDLDCDTKISQMEFHAFILSDDGSSGNRGLKETLDRLKSENDGHDNKVRSRSRS